MFKLFSNTVYILPTPELQEISGDSGEPLGHGHFVSDLVITSDLP